MKDFDSIKMHGTAVRKSPYCIYCDMWRGNTTFLRRVIRYANRRIHSTEYKSWQLSNCSMFRHHSACHLHAVYWSKGLPVQRASPGTDRPLWYHLYMKYIEHTKLQCCDTGILKPLDSEQCWVSGCILCLIQRCKRMRCCLSRKTFIISGCI